MDGVTYGVSTYFISLHDTTAQYFLKGNAAVRLIISGPTLGRMP